MEEKSKGSRTWKGLNGRTESANTEGRAADSVDGQCREADLLTEAAQLPDCSAYSERRT